MTRFLLPLLTLSIVSAAHAQTPFKLILSATEHELRKGEVVQRAFTKSWTLPAAGVEASRKRGGVSSTLSPVLDRVEAAVNARTPRPAVFRNVGGTWVAADRTGWVFDRNATKASLLQAIQAGQDSAPVVYRQVAPQRSVAVLAQRGVRWHVASGASSYRGSPAFRVKNVLVGAGKLDNFFIAPGHDFDFNREVGQISASTGFVKGFVISGGTLAREDGGGICQVSTTIFRALYQAGLPIVERHEHSHRVSYYDPVGFEATVYAPYKNLRMKNDTGASLFVQAAWDTRAQTLRFDVFGAQTGRRVTVSEPVVTAITPAAGPTFTPDARVAPGRRRLLDTPMPGMTSVITRTVKVDGHVVSTDTLKSVYRPWGAVYGVAPGDRRL